MRKLLTLDAVPERPSGSVLLQIAVILRQLDLDPEELIWSATSATGKLKLSLRLDGNSEHWLEEIAERLGQSCGMRDIRCVVTDDHGASGDASPQEARPSAE